MAATKAPGGAILLAALALPGLAAADNAPENGSISVKYLDYKDSQSTLDRISVHSPSVELLVPIAGVWSLRAALVSDAISGASPRYHTAVSGASHFDERRSAVDATVTRYFARASVSVSAGRSGENDYLSRFLSSQASFSSADNNRSWLVGAGVSNDHINPVNLLVTDEAKHSTDLMAGLTEVLGTHDLGQAVLTHTRGRGYFSNPYKYVDNRPREHDQDTLLLRWNHHIDATGASNRLSYRYFSDSWDVHAHTLQEEYAQPLAGGWTVTPSLRLYTQSAASFYFDPVYDSRLRAPFPPGYIFGSGAILSADQRLSAFGALTVGLKLEKRIGKDLTLDLKWESYEQRSHWRQFGSGSPGLEGFSARSITLGLTSRW
ncbi:MAG: DUF3570 domain-containing protein [Pseudomonadota bacterium]